MKTQTTQQITEQQNQRYINDFKYLKNNFEGIKSNLDLELFRLQLKESELIIILENFFPRISLGFMEKNNAFEKEMYAELRKNQVHISQSIADVAEKYELEASSGQFVTEKGRRGRGVNDLGFYTISKKREK